MYHPPVATRASAMSVMSDLRCESVVPTFVPTCQQLGGVWEGSSIPAKPGQKHTPWNDVHLVFNESKTKPNVFTLQGQGYSLWKGERIPFVLSGSVDYINSTFTIFKTHQGRYTNTLMCTGVVDFSNGLLHGSYGKGTVKLSKVDKTSLLRSQSGRRIDHLSGPWTGHVSTYKTLTTWADCVIEFYLEDGGHCGQVEGKGFSLWKHDRIPFILSGSFDLKTQVVNLKKQHCSERYRNSMEYKLILDADKATLTGSFNNGTVSLSKTHESFDLELKESTETLFESIPYEKREALSHKRHTEPARHAEPPVRTHPSERRCRANNGCVLVQRTHSDNEIFSEDSGDESLPSRVSEGRHVPPSMASGVSGGFRKEPVMRKQRSVSFGSADLGLDLAERLENMNLTEKHTNGNLTAYKAFLAGCIVDGVVSNTQLEALKSFREKHEISEKEHVQILMEVGLNAEKFKQMHEKPSLKRDKSSTQSDDTCKVCFDRVIDCVLLPCGHFAICSACARALDRRHDTRCPICRSRFYEAKRVYRS